jgi:hypothetical protein
MSSARTFAVKRVDRPAFEGGDCVFNKAAFIEGVGVDRNLNVHVVGNGKAAVYRCGCCAPVFVDLQSANASFNLLHEPSRSTCIALAQKSEIDGKRISGFEHPADVPGPRRARRGGCTRGRARSAAHHAGYAREESFFNLLGTNEMNVGIDAACGEDGSFARDDLGAGPYNNVHVRLNVRIAGLADGRDAAVLDGHIGLNNSPMVEDERVGDDGVYRALRASSLRLPHSIADDLAATELHLFTVGGKVLFDFDQ